MFDGIAEWMTVPLLHFEHAGLATDRHGLTHASISPYRPFECSDGTILIAVQTAQEWERFCSVILERPDLATRPDFATNTLRFSNRAALDAEAEPVFSGLTFDQVVVRCSAAKIAWGRLSDVTDLVRHPALRRVPVTLPDGTEVLVPRPAGRSAGSVSGPLAETGQHTAAIRREFGTDRRC
jgi:crotonobetainyl-CoA:carnitine CoA-transferase CaiB-like acyl-CoA transferase